MFDLLPFTRRDTLCQKQIWYRKNKNSSLDMSGLGHRYESEVQGKDSGHRTWGNFNSRMVIQRPPRK